MIFGYARVSTDDQNHQLQLDALQAAGVDEIITDTITGTSKERPGLDRLLDKMREGDVVVVWRLDRLGRSVSNLIAMVESLKSKGVHLKSLHEEINTSTANGQMIFHMFAAMAQFERDLLKERTVAGLQAARDKGRKGGRPSTTTEEQKSMIRKLAASGDFTHSELADQFGISRVTVHRILKKGE